MRNTLEFFTLWDVEQDLLYLQIGDDPNSHHTIYYGDIRGLREQPWLDNETYYVLLGSRYPVSGSDYSGTLVQRSNFEVLLDEFPYLIRCYGGHGTFDLALELEAYDQDETLRARLAGLDDYPLLDEEHHSTLEYETFEHQWDGPHGLAWEIAAEITRLGVEDFDLSSAAEPDMLDTALRTLCARHPWRRFELNNYPYYENEEGDSIYMDTDVLAAAFAADALCLEV